jgi:hypothetical protein
MHQRQNIGKPPPTCLYDSHDFTPNIRLKDAFFSSSPSPLRSAPESYILFFAVKALFARTKYAPPFANPYPESLEEALHHPYNMPALMDLPTEMLRLILSALADTNLIHLFASRRTCKTFQTVITDILTETPSALGLPIHNFLTTYFGPVFDSVAAGPEYAPDIYQRWAPFAALPWAKNVERREEWDREEASWRTIPLASASGKLVQWLQRVQVDQAWFDGEITSINGGRVGFIFAAQEDDEIRRLQFPRGIPLGLFYDMALPDDWDTEWKLLWETNVGDTDAFEKLRWAVWRDEGPPNLSEEDIKRQFVHDEDCAIMMTGTGERWQHYKGPDRKREEMWYAGYIGHDGTFLMDWDWSMDEVKYVPAPPYVRLCWNYPE